MATRQETQSKRRKMREAILESCQDGRLHAGDLLPPLRELARQYGLSVDLASDVIQSLVAEGVLYARQGSGIIVSTPTKASQGTYLFVRPTGSSVSPEYTSISYAGLAQRSFEMAIAQLGGACLAVGMEQINDYARNGQLPPLAGVFSIDPKVEAMSYLLESQQIPHVYFGSPQFKDAVPTTSTQDLVQFDNYDGGRQATQQLLASGHHKIAFIGLHIQEFTDQFAWSAEREDGWRDTMREAGRAVGGLAFRPSHSPGSEAEKRMVDGVGQYQAAREAVLAVPTLIQERKITAFVATNIFAARALFTVLQENKIAPELWPAVVSFDNHEGLGNHVVSALDLTWDEVGKVGAQLLWERSTGRLRGPDETRKVKMQLIPRLTCRSDWAESPSLVMPHLGFLALPG